MSLDERKTYTIRQKAGAMLIDLPRLIWALYGPTGLGAHWTRYRNREDRIIAESDGGGVRCEWTHTRDLHLCHVFPATGRLLLSRALREHPIRFSAAPEPVPVADAGPEVSFLVCHRGLDRLPLLQRVLQSIAGQRGVRCECIVAEQDVEPRVRDSLPGWVRHAFCRVSDLTVPFSRAQAFNAAARLARGRILVLHDNDLLVPGDYAAEAARHVALGCEVVNHKRFIFYFSESATIAALGGGYGGIPLPSTGPAEVVENATGGGSLAIDRAAFAEIGGFDEGFMGWGGEDVEFWQRALTRRVRHGGFLPLIHLWHPAQSGKWPAKQTSGMARMEALSAVPPEMRIRNLRRARGEE